jgi:hypothetical protein
MISASHTNYRVCSILSCSRLHPKLDQRGVRALLTSIQLLAINLASFRLLIRSGHRDINADRSRKACAGSILERIEPFQMPICLLWHQSYELSIIIAEPERLTCLQRTAACRVEQQSIAELLRRGRKFCGGR